MPNSVRPLALILLLFGAFAQFAIAADSAVADAAMNRDHAAIQALLQKKADVNAPQIDGATALEWAAYHDDLELADMLIAAGANPKLANREGATAMQLASLRGSAAMIEKLLKAGVDANERGLHGETPLMYAAKNGNVGALDVLFKHGAEPNSKESLRGTTPLMWAIEQGNTDAAKLLIQHGADVAVVSGFDSKGSTAFLADTVEHRALRVAVKKKEQRTELEGRDEAYAPPKNTKGGGLTALVLAARENHLDSVKLLVEAHADVNQITHYGWTPLLTAVQNRHYQLAAYLLDHGANPNIANNGGWTPLYLAVDNRNIEGGDYPVRQPDMDHLEFIKLLLSHGANVNGRVCGVETTAKVCKGDSTETRTVFTMQWLYEDGATPFLRAAQSGDVVLMKLFLEHGADPKIATANGDTALMVASGIGWVEGITYEWSPADNLEAVKVCLDLGLDPNAVDGDGRTALHGAAHKGRTEVVRLLAEHGAKLDALDHGSRDTFAGVLKDHRWMPIDYARGLVRVGVQSAIAHPDTEALLAKLMQERHIPVPPVMNVSICVTDVCKGIDKQ